MAKHGVTEYLSTFNADAVRFCDLSPDLLILLDDQGRIIRVWQGFTRALGYTEADVLGSGLAHLVDVNDLAIFIKSFNWFPKPQPFRMLCKGGGEIRVILAGTPLFIDRRGYIILRQI